MNNYRAFIKDIFYKAGLVNFLDWLLYRVSYRRNKKKNSNFRKANPALVIPPDYFLYETYQLDYEHFFKDGEDTASEIIDWTKMYMPQGPVKILDWGCGISRIAMHIHKFAGIATSVFACDINAQMIEFNKQHYKNISYSTIPVFPPTHYKNEEFGLMYAISVFTHIESEQQEAWIQEMYRVLKSSGILLFTTQGKFFHSKLLDAEKQLLERQGVFTKTHRQKGHRMMSTYNSEKAFRQLLAQYFEILEFYDGATNQSKAGGQDLWIVRKTALITHPGLPAI